MMWGSVCQKHPELEGERHNGGNCPECVKITKAAYIERKRDEIAVKYISRFRDKGGIEDLRKAKHVIEMLIQFEEEKGQ